MRLWHSFYEIVKLPIGVLVFGFLLLGIGNVINPAFTSLYFIDQPVVESIVHLFDRTGAFIVINFPLIFLLRIVSRKRRLCHNGYFRIGWICCFPVWHHGCQ